MSQAAAAQAMTTARQSRTMIPTARRSPERSDDLGDAALSGGAYGVVLVKGVRYYPT